VAAAITFTRERGVPKLLIVTTGLPHLGSPSLGARYFFAHTWARASGGQVTIALVAKPEMIDPRKFGLAVALSAGLKGDVFSSEDEAAAWLRSLPA
jgi:hypothetical protein